VEKDAQLYEIAYLIGPALDENEARDFHQEIKNKIQEMGGFVDNDGFVIKRKLSYCIKKMRDAYVASVRILIQKSGVEKIKEIMRNKNILRSLILETKRAQFRAPRARKASQKMHSQHTVQPTAISAEEHSQIKKTAETNRAHLEEIDKKLEEILGTS